MVVAVTVVAQGNAVVLVVMMDVVAKKITAATKIFYNGILIYPILP